ncbi:MAG TPA: hypothetical protein VLU23_20830 [Pseudolabrys sp.]|jgi:hypothetical protein|nr:hypothetical protein [Pseudolabrys sp.]
MQKNWKGQTDDERRSAWEPPVITKVEIGETKSAYPRDVSPNEPRPPSSPATKFGFSFEMAFPMSARIENSN